MTTAVLVLGAGFGGVELSSRLAEELGDQQVARIDVDFFSTPGHPTGTFTPSSDLVAAEKVEIGTSRRARWFGRDAG